VTSPVGSADDRPHLLRLLCGLFIGRARFLCELDRRLLRELRGVLVPAEITTSGVVLSTVRHAADADYRLT
jgi:hypothetical protein